MACKQAVCLAAAVGKGKGTRQAEGIKAVDIAPGGQDFRRADEITARDRRDVARVEGMQERWQFVIFRHQAAGARKADETGMGRIHAEALGDSGGLDAFCECAEGGGRQDCLPLPFGHRGQQAFHRSGIRRAAGDVHAFWDERAFDFHQPGADAFDSGGSVTRSFRQELEFAGEAEDQFFEIIALGGLIRAQMAPAADRVGEVSEALVEAGFGDGGVR